MEVNAILIHPKDNVAVVIRPLNAGEKIVGVAGVNLSANQNIPRNHKLAIQKIPSGGKIIKYGESIGFATEEIKPGDWVHTHNLKAEGS